MQTKISHHDAITMLNELKDAWSLLGGPFYNDRAELVLEIEGAPTESRIVLCREGTWHFQADVVLLK